MELGPGEISTIIITGITCIIGLLSLILVRKDRTIENLRQNGDDSREAGKQEGLILNKLGGIEKGVEQISHRLDRQDERYLELDREVIRVSESAKQAHKRLDELVTKEKKDES